MRKIPAATRNAERPMLVGFEPGALDELAILTNCYNREQAELVIPSHHLGLPQFFDLFFAVSQFGQNLVCMLAQCGGAMAHAAGNP